MDWTTMDNSSFWGRLPNSSTTIRGPHPLPYGCCDLLELDACRLEGAKFTPPFDSWHFQGKLDFCCNLQGPSNNQKVMHHQTTGESGLSFGNTWWYMWVEALDMSFPCGKPRGAEQESLGTPAEEWPLGLFHQIAQRRMIQWPHMIASSSQEKVCRKIGKGWGKVYDIFWHPPARSSTSWISEMFEVFQVCPSRPSSHLMGSVSNRKFLNNVQASQGLSVWISKTFP